MIRIVQGNPGSGKSYYAVNYLSKFCKWDELYKEWLLNPGVLVITNIEGLKIKHLNLESLLQRFPVEEFFTVENFERIQKQYQTTNIVVIIDEAQKIFDSKFFDKTVFYFFQYHRHLGIDIFFLTQSVSTIARHIIPLSEFIIEAQPRSKSVGVFRYRFKDQKGFYMYSQAVPKKKNVFNMYQSFTSDESEKPKNVLLHWGLMGLAVVVLLFIGGKLFLGFFKRQNHVYGGKPQSSAVRSVPPIQQSVTSAKFSAPSLPVHHQEKSVVPVNPPRRRSPVFSAKVPDPPKPVLASPPSPPVAAPSPAPVAASSGLQDGWKVIRVTGLVLSGGRQYLAVGDSLLPEYRHFDSHKMTAEIPPDSQ